MRTDGFRLPQAICSQDVYKSLNKAAARQTRVAVVIRKPQRAITSWKRWRSVWLAVTIFPTFEDVDL